MADLSTLARPYAKAAYDCANESNATTNWENFLEISSSVVSDGEFKQVLNNPAISKESKVSILLDICQSHLNSSTDNKVSTQINNFIKQLADNDRLGLIPQIYTHFRKYKSEASKQVDAYITSAYPLTDEQRILIQAKLASSMNATVVLHEEVDSALLAGATIKVGDKVVDDSVRGKLKQLRTQLTA